MCRIYTSKLACMYTRQVFSTARSKDLTSAHLMLDSPLLAILSLKQIEVIFPGPKLEALEKRFPPLLALNLELCEQPKAPSYIGKHPFVARAHSPTLHCRIGWRHLACTKSRSKSIKATQPVFSRVDGHMCRWTLQRKCGKLLSGSQPRPSTHLRCLQVSIYSA